MIKDIAYSPRGISIVVGRGRDVKIIADDLLVMSAIDDYDHPIPDRIVESAADDHNVPAAELHSGIKTIDETDGLREKLAELAEDEDGWKILKETRFATYYLVKDCWMAHLTNDSPESPSDMTQALEQYYKRCIIAKVSDTVVLDRGFILSN